MTRNKILIIICSITLLVFSYSCGQTEKGRIAKTMREYVAINLAEKETFKFIGLSNRRDTTFMGVTRPCSGVIYTITDNETGETTRHFADVIFSDNYMTALSVTELDFDPIGYAEEKVRDAFKEKICEKFGK